MIGLIAALVTATALNRPAFLLAVVPYILRIRWKNLSLIAFYAYVLVLITSLPQTSVYTWRGLQASVLVLTSTFLLLDDVLGGISLGRREIAISALIIASSLDPRALLITMTGATVYRGFLRFGRSTCYLVVWGAAVVGTLYILRGKLPNTMAQASVIIGVSMLFLLFAERNRVEFHEVSIFEKE